MRLLKRALSIKRDLRKPELRFPLVLSLFAGMLSTALAQTAPYVLPYTTSTFAGPHAAYVPGAACGAFFALDSAGDGCLGSVASIGADPHDIRVDGQGNIYWIDDNGSNAIIHKISAVSGRMTAYVGSTVNTKLCTAANTKLETTVQPTTVPATPGAH